MEGFNTESIKPDIEVKDIKLKDFESAFYEILIASQKIPQLSNFITIVKNIQSLLKGDGLQIINAAGNYCTEVCSVVFQLFPDANPSNGNGATKTMDERIKAVRHFLKQKPADSIENKLGRKLVEYLDMVRYLRNCAQHADTGAEVDEVDSLVVVTSIVQISKVLIMLCNKAYVDKKKDRGKEKEKEKDKDKEKEKEKNKEKDKDKDKDKEKGPKNKDNYRKEGPKNGFQDRNNKDKDKEKEKEKGEKSKK